MTIDFDCRSVRVRCHLVINLLPSIWAKEPTMTNNDLLRRLRYALHLNGVTMAEIFALGGYEIGPVDALRFLKKEDEFGFDVCDNKTMNSFLDGLITYKRGRQEQKINPAKSAGFAFTNNLILRKLRIALELNDEAMIALLKLAEVDISKPQLSAMFRIAEHRNYKECGDQFLRNFIRGLTLEYKNRVHPGIGGP